MSAGPTINGATRLYAIVGDPIVQVRSPQTFTEAFVALGVNAILVPAQIAPDDFDRVFPALMDLRNLDGLLVTVPFKGRATTYATRLGTTARCIGALNALRREADGTWLGDMFDGAGFVHAAKRKGYRLEGRRVALFGAGGAGSAIACALAEAGVARVDLIDPMAERVASLVARLREAFPAVRFGVASHRPPDADMVVNASTVGMKPGDGLPCDLGALDAQVIVGDVINVESPSPMIRHAMSCGCPWVSGPEMHAGQGGALVAFFDPQRARHS